MITEALNPSAADIDLMSVEELVALMNKEDMVVVEAVKEAESAISLAITNAIDAIKRGGRLIYIGAGTSGRLGIIDASEIPPTFNTRPGLVKAIIAGGRRAITRAVEGAEDNEEEGKRVMARVRTKDMVLGISASGRTPFTISALKEAKEKGARAWLLTCNDIDYPFLDGIIKVMVGPEIIAGSTRLKAGSATKMVLNMLSTITMVRLGRVYKGYMIDVVPSNKKLKERALGIIERLTGCTRKEAEEALNSSKGNVKIAVLMVLGNIGYKRARALLRDGDGSLRVAIEGLKDEIGLNRSSNSRCGQERDTLQVFNSGTAGISPKNFKKGGNNDKKA